jgi:class 3 adenylate cyclase
VATSNGHGNGHGMGSLGITNGTTMGIATKHRPGSDVVMLMTDLEGSTKLWQRAPVAMSTAMARHDELVRQVVRQHHGTIVKLHGGGDSVLATFRTCEEAVAAATTIRHRFDQEPWPTIRPLRVRVAVHRGEVERRNGDLHGLEVHRCARLRDAAEPGQILVSAQAAASATAAWRLGLRRLDPLVLRDIDERCQVLEVTTFGSPRTDTTAGARVRAALPPVARALQVAS